MVLKCSRDLKTDLLGKIMTEDSLCSKCGTCAIACPHGVLVQKDKNAVPVTYWGSECISCGHCVAICPNGAIIHEDYMKNRIKLIDRSIYPSSDQVLCLLNSRRSIRAFQDKKVEKKLVELLISGAKSAPSSSNSQNIEYVVVQDPAILGKIVRILADFYGKLVYLLKNPEILDNLPEIAKNRPLDAKPLLSTFERIVNRIKAQNDILQCGTPTLLVAHAPNKPFDWPLVNASIALQNISLLCGSLGLGSCQLGYIETIMDKDPKIQELLDIPDSHAVYGVLALGYPDYTFDNWIEKKQPKITWKL